MPDLTNLYFVVGTMVVTNFAAIGALIVFIFKCGQFVSDTRSGIKDAKETGVRAHKRIDVMEQDIKELQ